MARKVLLIGISLALICSIGIWAGGQGEQGGAAARTEAAASTAMTHESPLLTRMVEEGLIPPLAERLPVPDDIYVVEPNDQIGRYGGTARTFNAAGENRPYTAMHLMGGHGPFRASRKGYPGVPHVYKSYEVNDDFTEWTFHLREGLKYSDGYPLTTENMLLYWKHDRANPDINPSIISADVVIEDRAVTFYNEMGQGRTVRKEAVDDYTLRYTSDISYPTLIHHLSHPHNAPEYFSTTPMHFMMQFHPDAIGLEAAEELAEKAGFDEWFQLYNKFAANQGQ